jgi:bifunctional DNA-binding transcriptional regulator/antitoxin component of YhaV-PrlF toxin-antitoxin module
MQSDLTSCDRLISMKIAVVSKGGQISIPAEVRRRWGTTRLLVEDRGHALVLRPFPDDPIGAARGSLAGSGPASDEARALLREEEILANERHGIPS